MDRPPPLRRTDRPDQTTDGHDNKAHIAAQNDMVEIRQRFEEFIAIMISKMELRTGHENKALLREKVERQLDYLLDSVFIE